MFRFQPTIGKNHQLTIINKTNIVHYCNYANYAYYCIAKAIQLHITKKIKQNEKKQIT